MRSNDAVATRSYLVASALAIALGACGGRPPEPVTTSAPAASTRDAPMEYFVFAVNAAPDSAVKFARFVLGAIDGTIGLPRISGKTTQISTRYVRPRYGGGTREVAIIAAVDRAPADAAKPTTLVELAAFALDLEQAQTAGQRRSRAPSTPLSANAPALKRPVPLTRADTSDWRVFEIVLEGMVSLGARRQP